MGEPLTNKGNNVENKAVNNVKHRMLKLLAKGKIGKTVLTMSVRDHNAVVRKKAFNELYEAELIETALNFNATPGRPKTLVRITNKGKQVLKDYKKENWQ